MHAHRINPVEQMFSGLGFSALDDLGKTFMSSITSSLSKSIFGEGTSSFGQGLAKMLGIGGPGGLLGSGLGGVKDISRTTLLTTSNTLLGQIAINTGSTTVELASLTATSGAGAATSTIGAAGSAGGFLSGIPIIGGWLSSLFGGGAAAAQAAALDSLGTAAAPLGFHSGGIVPSAAGGWVVPNGGAGGIPSLLHSREMVLPEDISTGLQSMIGGGGTGGDMHLHFHGPADAPSMNRWFKNMMSSNPERCAAVLSTKCSNASKPLTTRKMRWLESVR